MVEVGVVALDSESTVETVADGMAPHPTLSEAIKEAALQPSAARSNPRTEESSPQRLRPLWARRAR